MVNWWFWSWAGAATQAGANKLRARKQAARWWLHQLSTGPAYVAPVEVPGSEGTLWRLDIRDYGWNAAARRAVSLREPYTREPHVDHGQAALLRNFIGEKRAEVVERLVSAGGREEAVTSPVVGVVRADWVFRDTLETDRSPSYYDLLYARKRFPGDHYVTEEYVEKGEREWWPGGTDPSDGRHYAAGWYRRRVRKTRRVLVRGGRVDFPKTEDEFNDFWGAKAAQDFFKRQKIDVTRGVVVPGSRDDPVRGSVVARNNRVLTFVDTPFGVWMKSFDVRRTSRAEDFIERPGEVVLGKIRQQATELLASTPPGGQTAFLADGQGKRTEIADGRFTHPRSPDTRTPDVRTAMSCVVCHAPDGGVIEPRNLFKDFLKSGVDLNVKDRALRNQIRAFFLEWEHRLKGWRGPYLRLIERATSDPASGLAPLTPAALVAEFLAFRDWYDDPVTPEQAAHELGVPTEELKRYAASVKSGRAGALAQGMDTPREVWERDLYLRLALALAHKHRREVAP